MKLCYDIIYKIYFWVQDYPTLLSFFVLNKEFYEYYMKRYDNSYKHRFMVLFKNIFSFLKSLPYSDNNNINMILCINNLYIDPLYKNMITKDIYCMYNLYKSVILKDTIKKLGPNLGLDVTNIILIQGPEHINKNTYIKLNKNKIAIFLNKNNRILSLNISLNFMYLRNQFNRLENTISNLP